MKFFSGMLFFLFVGLSPGCNQTGLGIGAAVKNLITTPYRAIRGSIANGRYNDLQERTEKARRPSSSLSSSGNCRPQNPRVSEASEEFEGLRDAVRDSVCSCKAWGDCSKELCACDVLCPDTFEIFNRRPIENLTRQENSLAFRSGSSASEKHQETQGFCWGHASMTSKFNRLAFFDEQAKPPYDINSEDEEEQNRAIDYYKARIDKIAGNEVAQIKGFANLQDFSDHPSLQAYIGDKVASAWANNAMTFQGLGVGMGSSAMPKNENEAFFEEVKEKIDNHQQPQVVFTREGVKMYTHAVLVSRYIENDDGSTTLCIRDNKYPPEKNASCSYNMRMEDGKIVYDKGFFKHGVGKIKLAHNDNRETVEQFHALREHCQSEKDCGDSDD